MPNHTLERMRAGYVFLRCGGAWPPASLSLALNVLARAGSKCSRFLDANVHNVRPESVQADEMFCYVACKERNNTLRDPFRGDQYLFLAMDSGSKLIISHVIGKRTASNTHLLLADLRERVPDRMQLFTDGYEAYKVAVPRTIGRDVDFAQVVKVFASETPQPESSRFSHRYSVPRCTAMRVHVRRGNPDPELTSTSYVERTNLSVRLFNRRFTRLTLGYSKKFEYLRHSIALFVAHYNFCRKHAAHGTTPAQAAGLTDHALTIEEILMTGTDLN